MQVWNDLGSSILAEAHIPLKTTHRLFYLVRMCAAYSTATCVFGGLDALEWKMVENLIHIRHNMIHEVTLVFYS